MTETESYTSALIVALRWFETNEPSGLFGTTAPSAAMRRNLERRGLIEQVPDPRPVHWIKYRLTEKARAVLRERA